MAAKRVRFNIINIISLWGGEETKRSLAPTNSLGELTICSVGVLNRQNSSLHKGSRTIQRREPCIRERVHSHMLRETQQLLSHPQVIVHWVCQQLDQRAAVQVFRCSSFSISEGAACLS